MIRFLVRRILLGAIVMLLVMVAVFLLFFSGDPPMRRPIGSSLPNRSRAAFSFTIATFGAFLVS